MLHEKFGYIIVHVQNWKAVPITNWCVNWKLASDAEKPVLEELQFHWMGKCCISNYRPSETFVEGHINVGA
jgi:hypothetical protein